MINTMSKALAFAESKVGRGYIYGATGWVCSLARRKQQAEQYPDQYNNIMVVGAKWDGVQCYDCAQLTRWAIDAAGGYLPSGANSQWRGDYWLSKGEIATLPRDTPCLVYRLDDKGVAQHTGIYMGDGTVIEAWGTSKGVIRSKLGDHNWTHWAIHTVSAMPVAGDDTEIDSYTSRIIDVKTGLNLRSTPVMGNNTLILIPPGKLVEVYPQRASGAFAFVRYAGMSGYATAAKMERVTLTGEMDDVPELPGSEDTYAGDGHIVTVSIPEIENIVAMLAPLCADHEADIARIQTILASWLGNVG